MIKNTNATKFEVQFKDAMRTGRALRTAKTLKSAKRLAKQESAYYSTEMIIVPVAK